MNIIDKLYFLLTTNNYLVEFDKEGAPSIKYKSGETFVIPSIRKTHNILEIDELNIFDLKSNQCVSKNVSGIIKDLRKYCHKRNIEVILMGGAWEKSGMYENIELDIPNKPQGDR